MRLLRSKSFNKHEQQSLLAQSPYFGSWGVSGSTHCMDLLYVLAGEALLIGLRSCQVWLPIRLICLFPEGDGRNFWPVDLGQLRFSFWMHTTKSLATNWQCSHICLINRPETSSTASAHCKLPGSSSKAPLQMMLWHTEWHIGDKVRSKNKNPRRPPRNNVTTQLHKSLPPFPGQPPTPQHPIVSPFVPIITWKLSSTAAESSSPTHRDAHALLHQRGSPAPIFKATSLLLLSKGRTFRSVLRHGRVIKISYLVERGQNKTTHWIGSRLPGRDVFTDLTFCKWLDFWFFLVKRKGV